MRRNGRVAASLFCALSIGGVLTLFSQAEANRRSAREMRTMNIAPEGPIFRVLPATLEGSAVREPGVRSDEADDDGGRRMPPRLKLH